MQSIFEHQHQLMHKYHPIEESLGYAPPDPHYLPITINSRDGQDRLRQFAWWVTEECVEAMLASPQERAEELSDVLHFLTELCLLAGVQAPLLADIKAVRSMEIASFYTLSDVILHVGRATNLLKMKPWKQSPKQTDPEQYRNHVRQALITLINVMLNYEVDPHEAYFNKHKVNQTRIQEGY